MKHVLTLIMTGTFFLVAPPNIAQASPDRGLRISACLRNELKTANLPREADLRLGQPWTCDVVYYYKAYDPDGSGAYAVSVLDEAFEAPEYIFDKVPFGFSNRQFLQPAVGIYKILELNEMEGVMSVETGIHNGFLWDYIRVTEQGYLVVERSVLANDVQYTSNPLAPPSLLDDDRRAITYRMCRPRPEAPNVAWPTTTCFDVK